MLVLYQWLTGHYKLKKAYLLPLTGDETLHAILIDTYGNNIEKIGLVATIHTNQSITFLGNSALILLYE